jgi:hypothetical protein
MVQLYTANHPITTGIADLMKVIVLAGKAHDLDIEINNSLSSKVVLFIDEFSSRSELKRLLRIKKKKKLNYVLVSTEFETNGPTGASFNEFSATNKYTSALVLCVSLLLYWTPKSIRNGKIFGKLSACLGLFVLLPTLLSLSNLKWSNIVDSVRAIRRAVYLKARRRGYDEFRPHADLIVKIHEQLTDTRIENVLYPVLSQAAALTNERIKVSGTQTQYRIKRCNAFSQALSNNTESYVFEYDGSIKFDAQTSDDMYGFAYQPAQSQSWDKSNPIKIWRDYYLHGAVPIVDEKFGDHPIEVIAITTRQFFAHEFNCSLVRDAFADYNESVFANNKEIFREMLTLQDNR